MRKLLALALMIVTAPALAQPAAPPSAAAAAAVPEEQAHADLRAMKDRLVAALNTKNADALLAELDPQVRLTTMDGVLSKGPAGAKAYYDRMMSGASKVVEDMAIKAEPDERSTLSQDGKVAVTTGTALAHFRIVGGKEMDVPLRWTATSVNRDGKWKVLTAQFGADMFDNPVLAAAKGFATWLAAGTGLIGLLVGWLLGRRTRRA
jgi:ketosteroid isomerase-like protein